MGESDTNNFGTPFRNGNLAKQFGIIVVLHVITLLRYCARSAIVFSQKRFSLFKFEGRRKKMPNYFTILSLRFKLISAFASNIWHYKIPSRSQTILKVKSAKEKILIWMKQFEIIEEVGEVEHLETVSKRKRSQIIIGKTFLRVVNRAQESRYTWRTTTRG